MALTLTQNASLTFSTSDDARLDFMFHVIEGSSLERTSDLLEKSWKQSPEDTLKLLMYTRDIRQGKGIRAQTLLCLKWLFDNQFDVLVKNLHHFSEYGCWKDLFNLLCFVLFDEMPYDAIESREGRNEAKNLVSKYDRIILKKLDKATSKEFHQMVSRVYRASKKEFKKDEEGKVQVVKQTVDQKTIDAATELKNARLVKRDVRKLLSSEEQKDEKKKKRNGASPKEFFKFKTEQKKLHRLIEFRREFFNEKFTNDGKFVALYNQIVELVSSQLVKDFEALKKDESTSLLAKWIPNRGRQFDKHLWIQLPIAKEFLSKASSKHLLEAPSTDKDCVFQFEKIIVQLRKKMKIPETEMSAQRWSEIDYSRITSKAMFRYKGCFGRNDFENFQKFVSSSKTIKGATLTPAEMIREVPRILSGNNDVYSLYNSGTPKEGDKLDAVKQLEMDTLDKQWLSLIEDIKKKKPLLLEQTLAVCDVSGSMCYTDQAIQPIYGSIGLTLLLLHFTSGDWANQCIAFSEEPKLFSIDITKSLASQIREIMKIDAGLSTDLNKVFTLLLKEAKEKNIPAKKMPRVLFIFSDMEFDEAMSEKTNFEAARIQFNQVGFEMPMTVFWNLKGSKEERSTPVRCNENGVVLLSGYSAQTLNFFQCEDFDSISPLAMLNKILRDERYSQIQL